MERPFWTEAAWPLAMAIFVVIPAAAPAQQQAAKGKQKLSEKAEEIIEWIKKYYKVEVVHEGVRYPLERRRMMVRVAVVAAGGVATAKEFRFPGPPMYIQGSNPSLESVHQFLPRLKYELGKYPPALVDKTGLTRIILGRNIRARGRKVGGMADETAFLIEVEDGDGVPRNYNLAWGIHHEFFHVLDIAINGNLANRDVKFAALNGPKFRGYRTTDGLTYLGFPGSREDDEVRPGFLTKYSTSCVQEDKAEVFGFMFGNQRELQRRMKDDAIIRAKVKYIQELLEKFCPEMDEKFFEQLAAADSKKRS